MSALALVTGAAGGIGSALVRRLTAEGWEVVAADVDAAGVERLAREERVTSFPLDVTRAAEWERLTASLGRLDLACLNAGVLTGTASLAELDDAAYRRAVAVNVDGVVLGVRALAPLLERSGGTVVVTASLAGLTSMETDPVYALTKHAVVGFVRSVAPQLDARGIRIMMVNPGIADTPMLAGPMREALESAGFPLLAAEDVVDGILHAVREARAGEAFVLQPGREPTSFRFPGVPGPRVAGAEGAVPPPLPG